MTPPLSRRTLLGAATAAGLAGALTGLGQSAQALPGQKPRTPARGGWARARHIERKVRAPRFPGRTFNIRRYGAVEGGTVDSTAAIAAAIKACHRAGGGRVLVSPGRYLTGPIHLLSNVNLHVSRGATLLFSTRPADYLPAVLTRFEGMELYNYSPLIYAYGQRNIAVTGNGTLDGQADDQHWWPWKGSEEHGWEPGAPDQAAARDRLVAQVAADVPVEDRTYGEGDYLRSSFIEPYRCRNVLIEGVTILRSPMWEVHPTLCTNVLVRDVKVKSHGPNNDGCDPESCSMVVIDGCHFDTGDDCIAIKSGRNNDGRRVGVPCEDLLIQNCTMADGHGGVTIGSEMSGGVRNVFARSCTMSSPNLDIALRFKTNSVRGGFIQGFWAKNITVGTVAKSVLDVDFSYEEGPGHGYNPKVEGIFVENLTVEKATQSLNVSGYPDDHIVGLHLTDVDFGTTTKPPVVRYTDDVVLMDVRENGEPLVLTG